MLFGSYVNQTGSTADEIDFVEIGLASVQHLDTTEDKYIVQITEPLSIDVIKSLLDKPLESLLQPFKALLKIEKNGKKMEQLLSVILCDYSLQNSDITVADFAKLILPENVHDKIPMWAK